MKKLFITIFLLTSISVHAQTDEKEALRNLDQNLSLAYRNQKYDEALKFAQQALDISLRLNGENGDETFTAYKNLGLIYRELRKYKNSAENLQKALEIYQKNSKPDAKVILTLYDALALSQFLSGLKKEAEFNYLKAVEVSENALGKDSREYISAILETAIFYSKTDNYEKSQDYYLNAYALIIKNFGKDSNEMESAKIYSSYYSNNSNSVWTNDKSYKEYKKKYAELLGYEPAVATSLPIPAYPSKAIKEGKQGRIVVKIWIDEQGKVTDAKAVYGEMSFASTVEEAAKKAKFKPSMMNGKPIGITEFITYKFVK